MHRTGPGERQMADVNPWSQVVGTMVGTLIGGLLTFAGVIFQQEMTSKREHEARREESESRRTQQRNDFQIQTLRELQDVMLKLQNATWRIRDARSKGAGVWLPVPEALAVEHDADLTLTYALMVRVADQDIRDRTKQVREHAIQSRNAGTEEEAKAEATAMNNAIDRANTHIGEVLRSLYCL